MATKTQTKTQTWVSGACPSFFRAACRAAAGGGTGGYDAAGYSLAGSLAGLILRDAPDDAAAAARLDALGAAVYRTLPDSHGYHPDDGAVLAWLVRELPRCMGLVPARRRRQFLRGFYRYAIDEGNDVTVD